MSVSPFAPRDPRHHHWSLGWSEGHLRFLGDHTGPKNGDLMPGLDAPIPDPVAILELPKEPKRLWDAKTLPDPIDAILNPKTPAVTCYINGQPLAGVTGISANLVYVDDPGFSINLGTDRDRQDWYTQNQYVTFTDAFTRTFSGTLTAVNDSLTDLWGIFEEPPVEDKATKDRRLMKDHLKRERRRQRNGK